MSTNPSESSVENAKSFIYLEHSETYVPEHTVSSQVLQVHQNGSLEHLTDYSGGYLSKMTPIIYVGNGAELILDENVIESLNRSPIGPNPREWFVFQKYSLNDDSSPDKEIDGSFYYVLSKQEIEKLKHVPWDMIDYPGGPFKR